MGKFQLAVSNFSDREELEDVGAVISGLSWPGLVQFFLLTQENCMLFH